MQALHVASTRCSSGTALASRLAVAVRRPSHSATHTPFSNRTPLSLGAALRCAAEPRTAEAPTASGSDADVAGLSTSYCDDFQCTSSPAVEQTIRSIARDLERSRWTYSLFARDVEYSSGARRFKGREGYRRNSFVADCVEVPQVTVLAMRMVGGSTDQAVVEWQLQGRIQGVTFTAAGSEALSLNLVTGMVTRHNSVLRVTSGGPLAAAALALARTSWALQQNLREATESGDRALTNLMSSDEDANGGELMRDPSDPNKFFQQNDTSQQDAISFALLVAVLWVVVQGWASIFTL